MAHIVKITPDEPDHSITCAECDRGPERVGTEEWFEMGTRKDPKYLCSLPCAITYLLGKFE